MSVIIRLDCAGADDPVRSETVTLLALETAAAPIFEEKSGSNDAWLLVELIPVGAILVLEMRSRLDCSRLAVVDWAGTVELEVNIEIGTEGPDKDDANVGADDANEL